MITTPQSRDDIIKEALLNITLRQNNMLCAATTIEAINTATAFAADAAAELQTYFTRSKEDLQKIADKYKVKD